LCIAALAALKIRNPPDEKMKEAITLSLISIAILLTPGVGRAQELRRSGFLGIAAVELTDAARKQLPPNETGILVQNLVEGGTAKDSGILINDIITQVNEHKVVDVNDFVQTAKSLHAGDRATIHLRRGGEPLIKQLLVKPRPYETAPDVETIYQAVSVDGSLRRVIITVPKAGGKHPAVLYINGIGCFSQESANLQSTDAQLLYGLTRAGFVTMRVEKSGMGDSEGPPCSSVDLEAERRGYLAALKALKDYPAVDPNNIFLVGLSIGGVHAPIIAAEIPVKGIVVINTVIKPFLEYLIDTRRRQNLLAHVAYDEMDRRARINERCNHRMMIEQQSFDTIVKDSPECRDYITYPASDRYMQQWAALNPAEEWKKITAPVLIVYGTADFVSTIADDPLMAKVIDSFHPGHATIKAIPNMDHTMYRAASMEESMNRPATAAKEFEPAVLEAIKSWLQQQTRTSEQP
jgi:pimeloyl-ACP methyl ester carboxylesterase